MEAAPNELILEPGRVERQYWRDLWRYRELFFFLAWRDILVRYKQTVVGIGWAIIRPVLMMTVLTIVFGKLAKFPAGGVPYPILVFSAILPWQFFAAAMAESGNSLVSNASMISKVYFPRIVMPASKVVTSLVDFLISCCLFGLVLIGYRFVPQPEIVLLPFFVILALAAAFGVGLWISALMVRYRDFRIIIPFLVQFGLYISPVGFSSSVVPEQWRLLYSLNPMAGVIDGFRWAILGGEHQLYLPGLALSIFIVALVNLSGFLYFRRTERTFADVI